MTDLHTIPFRKLNVLAERVEKMNRRAAKLGIAPVVLADNGVYCRKETTESGNTRIRAYVDVVLVGATPKIAGHSFVAKLEHLKGGNLVSKAPGARGFELQAWQQAGARCQHCGLARHRSVTYLIANESGGLIQVGANCLADYLRSENAAEALQLGSLWAELVASFYDPDGDFCGGRGGWGDPSPFEAVAAAVSSVRHFGFRKSDQERSTKGHVRHLCGECPSGNSPEAVAAREAWKAQQPTEADQERAKAIIEWISASTDPSDYSHNLRVAVQQCVAPDRTLGLLASAPTAYDKHLGIQAERKARPVSVHFGTVGQKFDAVVAIVARHGYDTYRGDSGVIVVMRDAEGHVFKWFTTSDGARFSDISGEFHLRATVKKHDSNRGTNETIVTRADISREPFPPMKVAKPRKPKAVTAAA